MSEQGGRLPRQIAYIIGSEGCERFSFYGMRNILTVFLASYLLVDMPEGVRESAAKDVFHTFVIGVYFFPLLGGWLADRLVGKYNTIFWLSLVYVAGHGCLAAFESSKAGFYLGLALIAIGSGGIKPCVSAFVGDQFDQTNKHLARVVFDAFYWIINFGSFFASLLMPVALRSYGPSVAFGIPGLLMLIALVVFWMGRRAYVRTPPSPRDPHAFSAVAWTALRSGAAGRVLFGVGVVGALGALLLVPSLGFVVAVCLALVVLMGFGGVGTWLHLDRARGAHPDEAVDGARSVLRLLVIFALVTPFWSLFDQKASTWVLQAADMAKPEWFAASQMQALNPLLVMLLIPFNNAVLYPTIRRLGVEPTALRRMGAGILFASFSWIVVGGFQLAIDGGQTLSITWQILPYALLTFGEVLVSATGLEFAYSQAPARMKGTLMSFWSLSVTVGNLWVLLVNGVVKGPAAEAWVAGLGVGVTAFQMFFFAGFAAVAALAFAAYAAPYPMVDNYRKA